MRILVLVCSCAPSLCSSHHSALDFISTLFNLASSQCKPKYSTELAVSPSTGRRAEQCGVLCVCVCVLVGTFGGEWKYLILLDQEALNHTDSSWKDPEGAGLSRLDLGRLSEPEPGLSLTPSWWRAQFLPLPREQATPSLCSPGWHAAGAFLC